VGGGWEANRRELRDVRMRRDSVVERAAMGQGDRATAAGATAPGDIDTENYPRETGPP
jgi:hypothetical protein